VRPCILPFVCALVFSHSTGTDSSLSRANRPGNKATNFHIRPRLRMSGSIPARQHTTSLHARKQLSLLHAYCRRYVTKFPGKYVPQHFFACQQFYIPLLQIIIPSMSMSPKRLLSFRFPPQNGEKRAPYTPPPPHDKTTSPKLGEIYLH